MTFVADNHINGSVSNAGMISYFPLKCLKYTFRPLSITTSERLSQAAAFDITEMSSKPALHGAPIYLVNESYETSNNNIIDTPKLWYK